MGREHDADAELLAGATDEAEHLLSSAGVESGCRLVEQNHDGVVDEGLGELDALLHAGGVLFDVPVALLVEADVAEDVGGAGAGGDGGDAAHLGHVPEELGRRDGVGEAVVLGHVTEPHAHLDVFVGLFAEDLGVAGGGREEAEKELHGRALARAVWPEQPGDAVEYLDVHPVERDGIAVALREALGFEKGPGGRCCGHALTEVG